jgi:cell fate regulator YaaT (PSP1 superfamily)
MEIKFGREEVESIYTDDGRMDCRLWKNMVTGTLLAVVNSVLKGIRVIAKGLHMNLARTTVM